MTESKKRLLIILSIIGYVLFFLSLCVGENRITNSPAYSYFQIALILMGMIFAGIVNFQTIFDDSFNKELFKRMREEEKERKRQSKK